MLKSLFALTLLTLCSVCFAQHEFPVSQPKFILALNKQVQEHLKLTEDQKKKIAGVVEGIVQDDGHGRQMIMLSGDTDMDQLDKDVLSALDKDQTKRYNQIYMQQNGFASLSRKEFAEMLGVNNEQSKKLEGVWANHRDRMQDYFTENAPGSKELKVTKDDMDKLRKQTDKEAEAVLTPEQLTKWKELQGEKFELKEIG